MNNLKTEIIQSLSEFLSQITAIPRSAIDPDSSLGRVGIDSAGTISLAAYIEDHFNCALESDDLKRSTTLDQLADFILKNRSE